MLRESAEYDINWVIQDQVKKAAIVQFFRKQIDEVCEVFTELRVECDSRELEIYPQNDEEKFKVLESFGGIWNKELETYNEGKLKYVQEFTHPADDNDKCFVILRGANPPPSCRIEEVQELVPAVPESYRTVKKIVCKEEVEVEA